MGVYYFLTESKAEPAAQLSSFVPRPSSLGPFRGEKGLKDIWQVGRLNAAAGVGDFYVSDVCRLRSPDGQNPAARQHGVAGIKNQIHYNVLNLNGYRPDRQILRNLDFDRYPILGEISA
jgi:hypothetical protein